MERIKIAVIGTQGVPANYGGFETLVENIIGENCPANVEYTVFCSSRDKPREEGRSIVYKGARLKYVPLHANGMQSVAYDMLSMMRCLWGYDVLLILGVSGCMFLPVVKLLSRSRLVINIDGLEHRRAKWNGLARWVLRTSEALAVRFADIVVADNKAIQDYVQQTYGKASTLIAYGGDHVHRDVAEKRMAEILEERGLKRGEYAITVCRVEPENNSEMILQAFARTGRELVFVGNWNHSDWSRALRRRYEGLGKIRIMDAIYDLEILYTLRSNAGMYVHGHSAGGTNPSLVEAMHFGVPIACYDVCYNRETTCNAAYYFRDAEQLAELLGRTDLRGEQLSRIADDKYIWSKIADEYVACYQTTSRQTTSRKRDDIMKTKRRIKRRDE